MRQKEETNKEQADSLFFLSRRVEFSAAHRLYREDWSEEKNQAVFGACANPYGHGHNYVLEVTCTGPLDPDTGMVVHFYRLKTLLQELVILPLDHRHLNYDVPFLSGVLPTSENLLSILWDQISQTIEKETWQLYSLRLESTPHNSVWYFGKEKKRLK